MITKQVFLNKIENVLDSPGMYGIQKVEDIKLIFFSEIFLNRNIEIEEWSSKLSHFVIKETNPTLENADWSKIIRFYSGSDAHSLELFKELSVKFENS